MVSQNRKKIYIINVNPHDFHDLTLEAIECLEDSSEVVSLVKLSKKFFFSLNKINCNIENKNEINVKSIEFSAYVLEKLRKVDSICVLQSNFLNFNDNFLNKKITLNSKIEIKYVLGITNVVNTLNKHKELLTNRDKNSSVIFIDEFRFPNIFETLKKRQFEKIIIRTNNINKIKSFITKIKRIKTHDVKYYIYSDYVKLTSQLLSASQNNGKDFYIVLENNE